MSFNFAYGPVDIFQGLDLNALNEYLASLKPDQPIDEYTGILEPKRPVTDGISGGFPFLPPPGMGNPPPTGEPLPGTAATAPPGIPIEYLIDGITGEPIIAVDPEEAGGPNLPDSGIETLPNTTPSVATPGPGEGITSLYNPMMFERMRSLTRQPRDYKSYIG
tara:strand:- start:43 stop:531 length:489 start_codon:yes stop_codon:yes gene_type:complete